MLPQKQSGSKDKKIAKVARKRLFMRLTATLAVLSVIGLVYRHEAFIGGLIAGVMTVFAVAFGFSLNEFLRFRKFKKTLPDAALKLGDFDPEVREKSFEELMRQGSDTVPILMQVLEMPMKESELFNWDGKAAHLLAIRGLARLRAKEAVPKLMQVLKEVEQKHDEALKIQTVLALGEIGDPIAIPTLVPFLGEQVADEALSKLGEGDLVDAFHKVLNARDETVLEKLKNCPYRSELAKALSHWLLDEVDKRFINFALLRLYEKRMEREREGLFVDKARDDREKFFQQALRNTNNRAANAAWALGELGLVEGLPALEKVAKRIIGSLRGQRELMETDYVLNSCIKAIAKLRLLATLPRPASIADIDTSVLPRPAHSTGAPSLENLPAIPQTDEKLAVDDESK